jgi:hypothetical protein
MDLAGGNVLSLGGEAAQQRPGFRLSETTGVGRTSPSLHDARITRLKIGSGKTTTDEVVVLVSDKSAQL